MVLLPFSIRQRALHRGHRIFIVGLPSTSSSQRPQAGHSISLKAVMDIPPSEVLLTEAF